jgi:predicted acetyltransferase
MVMYMEKGTITLVRVTKEATHEQTVLRSLLKMYCYEWSQYNHLEVDADGNFAFETCASEYWTKEGYHAFLIAVDEQWAGFVFFDTHDFIVHTDCDYSMAEFFVMHAYRHHGIGSYVATHQATQKPPWFSIQGERSTIVPMNRWRFALLRQASCALYQRCHSTLQCSASIGLNDSLRPILKSSTDMWEAIRWEAVWQPALPPSMPTSWKA